MSERNRQPNYPLRRAVAATALAATALGGIIGTAKLMEGEGNRESTVQVDVQKSPKLLNAQVILSESVNLRTSPYEQNGSQADPNNNIAGKVKPGEIVLLNSPVVYQNEANQTWYGVTDKEKGMYWVNATGLMAEQDRTGEVLIRVIPDENVGGQETQTGQFSNGEFFYAANDGGLGMEAATMSAMPAEMADDIHFRSK